MRGPPKNMGGIDAADENIRSLRSIFIVLAVPSITCQLAELTLVVQNAFFSRYVAVEAI